MCICRNCRTELCIYFILSVDVRIVRVYDTNISYIGGGTLKTKKHYTAAELAEVLGITKSSVHAMYREGRIEKPAVIVGNVLGWSEKQIETIKKEREECK